MELWTFATYVPHPSKPESKMSYFIDIVPYLQSNDGGDEQAVRKMMNQWRFETKPHVVTDSDIES